MNRKLLAGIASALFAAALCMVPQAAKAQVTYDVKAGAETRDQAVQGDGFFPNEVWLMQGDSIQWTFANKNEPHTATLLKPGQVRPSAPPPVGPPAGPTAFPASCGPSVTPPSVTYNGSGCVSSGVLAGGAKFTVTFPTAGNYKLVCLIHTDMTGTVHVLVNTAANARLIRSQRDYDEAGRREADALLGDDDRGGEDHRGWDDRRGDRRDDHRDDGNSVIAGTGEIRATVGGTSYRAVVRFLPGVIRIHAGESVVWTNIDPTEPHTVTFGAEPTAGLVPTLFALPPQLIYPAGPPIPNAPAPCNPPTLATNCVNVDTGTVLATINCTKTPVATAGTSPCDKAFKPQDSATYDANTFINSGFVAAAIPDRIGSAQVPPGATRIRVTFPNRGTYYYHCALHDEDGMNGTVIVE